MSVVVAERLTKYYGRRVGIDGLDLRIDAGTIFGFLGPNGSGKTTTIRLLMGFLRPDHGSVRMLGHDCWRHGPLARRDVGYVPGDIRLYPWLTARTAFRVFGQTRGLDLHASGNRLAEEFRLEIDLPVRRMSRGTRQKLGLVLALAAEPRLLILDEPSSGLDPLVQDVLFRHLRGLAAAGHTVFFSTHTLSEVEDLCDRVAILRAGKLLEHASISDLRRRSERNVTLRWKPGVQADKIEQPAFLSIRHAGAAEWAGSLVGPPGPFLQWCAAQPIENLAIGDSNLSSLFRKYYEAPEPDA